MKHSLWNTHTHTQTHIQPCLLAHIQQDIHAHYLPPDRQVCVCVWGLRITQTCCVKVYKVCKCPWDMLSKFNTPLYTLTTMPTFNTWTASAKRSGSAGLFWGFAPTHTRTHTHSHTHGVSWKNSLETLWLGIWPINILFPLCPSLLKSHFHRLTNTKAGSSLPTESVKINK